MTKLAVCNCYNNIKVATKTAATFIIRVYRRGMPRLYNYPSISWLLLPNTLIILCM